MGKAAREQHRLQEMASLAADLEGIAYRKFMVAGFESTPVVIRTQIGQAQGVSFLFHMQDDSTLGPVTFEPLGILNLIHACSGILIGRGGDVPSPNPSPDAPDDEAVSTEQAGQPETVRPSGLIVPT